MTTSNTTAGNGASPVALTKRQIDLVIGAVLTGTFLAALDSTIVNTALLAIVGDIGGLKQYTWVATSYMLTQTPAMAMAGKLSDIFGRLRVFQVGVTGFVIGSTLAGFAQSMPQLVGARAIQGVGGGAMTAMVFAVIGDLVAPRDRGRYGGAATSVWAIASLVGPVLGGLFVDHLSWRWIFWVNIPIGIAAVVIATRLLSRVDFKPVRQPIDFVGAALLVVAVVTLVLAISWSSREYGWASPATIGLVAVSVAATAVFIWWEGRVDEPFVPLRLFADPTFRWCVMMAGPLSITLSTCNTFLPLFFQAVGGVSPTNSGLLLAPILVGLVTGSAVCGRRISATGQYRIWMVVGSSMVAGGALTLTTLRDSALGITVAVVGMLMIGTGIGMSNPTATIAAQNSLDPRDLGVGTSMLMFFRTLAAALGLALYGTVFSTRISDRLKPELIDQPRLIRDLAEPARAQALNVLTGGVRLLFIVSVPLTILGSLAARAIREQPLRETARATEQTQSAAGSLGH